MRCKKKTYQKRNMKSRKMRKSRKRKKKIKGGMQKRQPLALVQETEGGGGSAGGGAAAGESKAERPKRTDKVQRYWYVSTKTLGEFKGMLGSTLGDLTGEILKGEIDASYFQGSNTPAKTFEAAVKGVMGYIDTGAGPAGDNYNRIDAIDAGNHIPYEIKYAVPFNDSQQLSVVSNENQLDCLKEGGMRYMGDNWYPTCWNPNSGGQPSKMGYYIIGTFKGNDISFIKISVTNFEKYFKRGQPAYD